MIKDHFVQQKASIYKAKATLEGQKAKVRSNVILTEMKVYMDQLQEEVG